MAAGPQEREAFVRTALERGCTKPEIQNALSQAGWPAEQIRSVVTKATEPRSPTPPNPDGTTRQAGNASIGWRSERSRPRKGNRERSAFGLSSEVPMPEPLPI